MTETKQDGPNFTSATFEQELRDKTLDKFMLEEIQKSCNEVFMIDAVSEKTLMLKEFLIKSYNVAGELQALGCKRNVIVGIMSENRLEYPIVVLATILTGATITCFNPAYTTEELEKVIEISQPSVIFCSEENYRKIVQTASTTCKIIVLDSSKALDVVPYSRFSQLTQSTKPYNKQKVQNAPNDTVFILYSSGTTGFPKGVMLTHRNLVFMMKVIKEERLMQFVGMTAVATLPMFHAFGMCVLLFAIFHNQTLVVMRKFEERLFLSILQKYKIRFIFLVPTLITFLLKNPMVNEYDLSSLEHVICGAAPIKPETEETFKKKFNLKYVQQGYGMTETTLITLIKHPKNRKSGSCGSVTPGAQIKVVHMSTGTSLPKNEVGELYIRGPHVMKGYFKNEKATAEAIDKDGWLRSGDIGYYDQDGDFFIVDRAKELIKYKGFQVAPAELEALLLGHPAVADSAVIGIPDEEAGEIPKAYVVKRAGTNVTENEIIKFIAGKVSPQKRLRGGVDFVQEIPKNPSGKILRRKLLEAWMSKCQHTRKSKL